MARSRRGNDDKRRKRKHSRRNHRKKTVNWTSDWNWSEGNWVKELENVLSQTTCTSMYPCFRFDVHRFKNYKSKHENFSLWCRETSEHGTFSHSHQCTHNQTVNCPQERVLIHIVNRHKFTETRIEREKFICLDGATKQPKQPQCVVGDFVVDFWFHWMLSCFEYRRQNYVTNKLWFMSISWHTHRKKCVAAWAFQSTLPNKPRLRIVNPLFFCTNIKFIMQLTENCELNTVK